MFLSFRSDVKQKFQEIEVERINNDTIYDREVQRLSDTGLLTKERLFVGKSTKGEVGLFIRDEKGKPRIKIYVDKNNKAAIDLLDENGHPVAK